MTYPDAPTPKEGASSQLSNAVSLEQLLSLRQKTNASPEKKLGKGGACASHQSRPAVPSKEGGHPNLPLILVLHEEQLCGSCIKTKLQCVASEAHFQWVKMDAQLDEQVHAAQLHAVLVQFATNFLDAAVARVKLLQQGYPALPVYALGSTQDSQAMLYALRAGVQDFLDIDAPDSVMRQSFQELLANSKAAEAQVHEVAKAPLVAIFSARTGVGSSLLAAHIAVFLQHVLQGAQHLEDGQRTAEALGTLLLDLGAPAGDGALYLDLVSGFNFMDAVQSLHRFDQKMASAGLAQHASGLRLLSLSRQGGSAHEGLSLESDLLVQRLGELFQYIVADLGGERQTAVAMRVALKANKVWLVCEQSLPSVVSTTELVRQLEAQQVNRNLMGLIVGRYDSSLELSAQHIADQLQLPLVATIPEHRAALLQAVNQGQLLSPKTRRDAYVQVIHKLVDVLLNDAGVAPASKQGAFAQILQRMRRG